MTKATLRRCNDEGDTATMQQQQQHSDDATTKAMMQWPQCHGHNAMMKTTWRQCDNDDDTTW